MTSHREVAENWIKQTGKATKGFNVWYFYETIYSYGTHFPIARIRNKKGRDVVFSTNRRASISTAKHISHVRSAIRGKEVYTVDDITSEDSATVSANLKDYKARIRALLASAERRRLELYREFDIDNAHKLDMERIAYARLYGRTVKPLFVGNGIELSA